MTNWEDVPAENWIIGTNDRAIEEARKRLPEAHLLRLCADRQGTCEHGHDGALRCVVCCLEIAGAEVNRLSSENDAVKADALLVEEALWQAGIDLNRCSTLDGIKHLIAIKDETERENNYLASLVMECQKALGDIVSRVGGHESHEWMVNVDLGDNHFRFCRVCGTVERRDKANKPCKGPTHMRPMER